MEKGRIVIYVQLEQEIHIFQLILLLRLRAAELECDCIYKATQVDGIYDKDPKNLKMQKNFKI